VLDDRKFFHPVRFEALPAPKGFSRRMMPPPNK